MLLSHGEYKATLEKIEKINTRALKKGFTGDLEVTATREEITTKNLLGLEVTEIMYETQITGEPPSYGGWKFLATLDWDSEAGLIVRTAPGIENVSRDGLREGWCEHCKRNRHRNNTYLVGNEKGDQIQVGSTCLKDFLGWNGSLVFFTTEGIEKEIDDYLNGGRYYEPRWTVDSILAASWAAIQVDGWKPASSYNGTTKGTVLSILDPRTKWDREVAASYKPYIEKSATQATIIRDWVLSDGFSGSTEYVTNLKAVANSETASARNIGLLASAPQAWAKAQEKDLIKRKEEGELVNEFSGSIGDKLDLKVTIKSIRYIDGPYGTSTLYILLGEDRKIYKWFSSNASLGETTDETVYSIRGTVKKHEEYNGNKSTVLTRCKVIK